MPKTKEFLSSDDDASSSDDVPKKKQKIDKPQKKPLEDSTANGEVTDENDVETKTRTKQTARKSKKPVEDAENDADGQEKEENGKAKPKQAAKKQQDSDDEPGTGGMYELTKMRFVSVGEFKGKPLVNIREYYEKNGKQLPGNKGISLTVEQWENLKKHASKIDKDLKKFA